MQTIISFIQTVKMMHLKWPMRLSILFGYLSAVNQKRELGNGAGHRVQKPNSIPLYGEVTKPTMITTVRCRS